jgi:hypothetical protein
MGASTTSHEVDRSAICHEEIWSHFGNQEKATRSEIPTRRKRINDEPMRVDCEMNKKNGDVRSSWHDPRL